MGFAASGLALVALSSLKKIPRMFCNGAAKSFDQNRLELSVIYHMKTLCSFFKQWLFSIEKNTILDS